MSINKAVATVCIENEEPKTFNAANITVDINSEGQVLKVNEGPLKELIVEMMQVRKDVNDFLTTKMQERNKMEVDAEDDDEKPEEEEHIDTKKKKYSKKQRKS